MVGWFPGGSKAAGSARLDAVRRWSRVLIGCGVMIMCLLPLLFFVACCVDCGFRSLNARKTCSFTVAAKVPRLEMPCSR